MQFEYSIWIIKRTIEREREWKKLSERFMNVNLVLIAMFVFDASYESYYRFQLCCSIDLLN